MNEETIDREDNINNLEKEKPEGLKRNKHNRNNKNDIKSQREKPKTVYIHGDSMAKKLNDYYYCRSVVPKKATIYNNSQNI